MKRPVILYTIEILLFLALLAVSLVLVVPAAKKMDAFLSDARGSLVVKLENLSGLGISYHSLSPSIFKSLEINDLVIHDRLSNVQLARIERVSIRFSVVSLLLGNTENVVERITLENGSVSFSLPGQQELFDTLSALFADSSDKEARPGSAETSTPVFIKAPEVNLRNLSFHYKQEETDVSGLISYGSAKIDGSEIAFSMETKLQAQSGNDSALFPLKGNISLEGRFERSLASGTAKIIVKTLESPLFSVSRIGLVASINEAVLTLDTVQDLQPVDISLSYDFAERTITGSFLSEQLLPFRWINVRTFQFSMQGLSDLTVSGRMDFTFNEKQGFAGTYALDAGVPDSLYGGGNLILDGSLSSSRLSISEASFKGPLSDITTSLDLEFGSWIPEGFLSVNKLILPNALTASGDAYFVREGSGFSCVIPSLKIGSIVYNSIELRAVPDGPGYELRLAARDSMGSLGFEGTFSRDNANFLQGFFYCDSLSLSDLISTGLIVAGGGNSAEPIVPDAISAAAVTTEIYFSTDFQGFSFNCPRLVLAPTDAESYYLLLSANGNNDEVQISNIEFSSAAIDITGNFLTSFGESDDILFNSSLSVNQYPFQFSGLFGNRTLSIYGDYGLALSILFDVAGGVSGSFKSDGLPVPISGFVFSLSTESSFAYLSSSSWDAAIDSLSIEELGSLLPLGTVFQASGSIDPTGLFLEDVSLTDQYSRITGTASLAILPGGVFGSRYLLDASLASADSGEKILVDSVISSGSDLYVDARFSLESFPLMRIAAGQTPLNLITASGTVSGSLDTLYSSVEIASSSIRLGESNLEVKGKATLEDGLISVSGLNAYWSGHSLSDFSGSYNLRSQRAEISSQWTSVLGKRTARSGLSLSFAGETVQSIGEKQTFAFPDIFTIALTFENFSWGSLVFDKPVSVLLVREQGITALYAGENEIVTGYLLDDGTFSLSAAPGLAVSFQSNGFIRNSELDLQVSNLMINIADLWPLTGIEFFSLDSGSITGDLNITGLMADPDFFGTLNVSDCYYAVPNVLKGRHGPISFAVVAQDKNVSIPSMPLDVSGTNALLEASAEFDGWFPSVFRISGRTTGAALPVDFNNSLFRAAGFAAFDIALLIDDQSVKVAGLADFQKGYFSMFSPGQSKGGESGESSRELLLDLNISIGKQVEFRWPSPELAFIRGLIQADEPLSIKIDTSQDSFLLKGKAALRGGEIFYLKRNFYLRQGSITLNETQNLFDPYITIRAEIRERDIDGEFVRIILSVDNQPLSLFSPVLSSDPARSEAEIMTLMGQVTTGDASQDTFLKDLVITSSDVLTQLSIFRNTENAVRDFLHLDLFSIRTLVLQNALLGQSGLDKDSAGMTIGNYFDNTTVYIGKYLGSAIYADALLHFSYYDPRSAVQAESLIEPYGNLLAQPEIGFEVNTPLFLLRWGFSPEHRDTLFVADNSVTLSWKFSY